jgi:BolA family transcriptional regulator, general stress-responsive regulator
MTSADRPARIRAALAGLEPESLDLVDESHLHAGHAGARSGGGHFQLSIVSARFEGLGRVARHQLIYAALGSLMQTDIHALGIQARAPGER